MHPGTSTSRRRRGLLAGLSSAAVLAATATVPSAWAEHYQASLEGSMFEIDDDANLAVDVEGNRDWANVDQVFDDDEPSGQGDDSYSGGVKEDTSCPGETTGSIPNNKSDLLQFGTWVEDGDPGFLHMYWVRVSEPKGTTLMDFEFNQSATDCDTGPNKIRTDGDLLLEYSIDQGGARAAMTLRRWDAAAGLWGPATDITAAADAAGTINGSPIDQTDTLTQDQSARTFGEASVDLDAIFDDTKCTSFGSAMLKSRSSDSFTSQLKDFISPVPLTLTNCGQVKISKQTDPDGATQLFDFAKSFGTDPSSTDRDTFQLADDETESFTNVLFGDGYTVSESSLPNGWSFEDIDCDASTGFVTEGEGQDLSIDLTTRTVTFDIDDDQDVLDCTFYNKALADLTIVKEVEDAPGGQSFSFTEDVPGGEGDTGTFSLTPTGTGADGSDSTGADFHGIDTGTYTVTETVPAGWNLVSATCDDEDLTDLLAEDGDGTITLGAGDDVTCTFVNERERGAIEITKTRKHAAAGGTAPHAGVTFTVDSDLQDEEGEPVFSTTVQTDATGTACVDGLLYGSYTVTETVPADYVSDDTTQTATVSVESTCGDGKEATVSFVNTPLTDVTVTVDSLVPGGTASTVVCTDQDDTTVTPDTSTPGTDAALGDLTVTFEDLEPTDPDATLICTITVDP
ncbi:MSCRAMM family protein [Ornithinimicrobium kibberense]|uniref:MSCRAMM family protein n=1 Tax=Ornithinimicrobium kibberense TaxID=282060 RepID=UPI0036068F25